MKAAHQDFDPLVVGSPGDAVHQPVLGGDAAYQGRTTILWVREPIPPTDDNRDDSLAMIRFPAPADR